MKPIDIQKALQAGNQFQNEVANWYTLCKVEENRFILVIGDKFKSYSTIESISKKIFKLINN